MRNRWTLFYLITFLFIAACNPDYQVLDKSSVRVVVDSYVQATQLTELDVLVVLDTSGSMSDNYNDVADGMDIL